MPPLPMTSLSSGDPTQISEHSTCTVAQIPPEVLSSIFLLYQSICRKPESDLWTNEPRWIAITHVCRAWREIAINDPALWCSIQVPIRRPRPTAFLDMQLERSKDRLITLHAFLTLDAEKKANEHAAETVLSLIPRLKVLKLVSDDFRTMDTLFTRFTTSADELVSLTVKNRSSMSFNMLSSRTPRLQYLHLDGCVWTPLPRINCLVHIRLDGNLQPRATITWDEVFNFLRGSQHSLRTLGLIRVGVNPIPVDSNSLPPLQLSQLEEVTLCDRLATLCDFLRCMRFSASARLVLENSAIRSDESGFTDILSTLPASRFDWDDPQIHHLRLRLKRHNVGTTGWRISKIKIEGWLHTPTNRSDAPRAPGPPSISLIHTFFRSTDIEHVMSISADQSLSSWGLTGYTLSQLESLTLDNWFAGPQMLWATLSQLPNLKQIWLKKSIHGFMRCLTEDSTAIEKRLEGLGMQDLPPEHHLHLKSTGLRPDRRFAVLQSVTFEAVGSQGEPGDWYYTHQGYDNLLPNLRLRHRLGCPLERLVFIDCGDVIPHDIEEMAHFVSEVRW